MGERFISSRWKAGHVQNKRGLNTKIHLAVDAHGMPVRILITDCFLVLKRWRGIAARYAKTSDAFIAAVHVPCIAIWAAIHA